MRHLVLFCLLFLLGNTPFELRAKVEGDARTPSDKNTLGSPSTNAAAAGKFQPFTGKITKNKVRVRLQPGYDAPVLQELTVQDLVIVVGESEDFYAIRASDDVRGYVFRTYVLDNVIEGTRVNVRLKPELEAPVVVQLNSGDRVEGSIASANNKWLEIKLPETAHFYIAKEYVAKAGDVGLKARLEKKRDEGIRLLQTAKATSSAEMQKPVNQIDFEAMKAVYQCLLIDYPEFPELTSQAKEAWAAVQEAYTQKKLAYLESQTHLSSSALQLNQQLTAELQVQKGKVAHLEQQVERGCRSDQPLSASVAIDRPSSAPVNMLGWLPVEEQLFHQWSQQTGNPNPQDFYDAQKRDSFVLRGIIEPYVRPIKTKPGDYMLISTASKLPIAFLYSTHVNLQEWVGREVAIRVASRPNHHFAFPAYFVLGIE